MASRSVWKGFIRFSLVTIPVKAYATAVSGGGGIALNQLHRECNNRIQYKKVCPVHGEVPADGIVSGYQFAENQYVVIDADEVEKLRTPADKSIGIDAFIKPDALDPRYFSGRTQFLVPDGPVAYKPYALLHQALVEEGLNAFASFTVHGKKNIVLVRPLGNLLAMVFLNYSSEVKGMDEFVEQAPVIESPAAEMKMAKSLISALTVDDFDIANYKDDYTEKLTQLIEAKVAGKQVVEAPADEAPQVINLMEALQKSLAAAARKPAAGKPPKLVAPSTGQAKETRKRKSS